MKLFDLTGRVAVVTGASSGLGRDAAMAYAQAGADVALLARRIDRLEEVKRGIEKIGRKALAVACDVTDEESVKNACNIVLEHFGKVDILLNNAGIAIRGSVEELSVEDWDKVMNTNVRSIFLMTKYLIPQMNYL